MEALREREDGWEGDLITKLELVGQGEDQQVIIETDLGQQYTLPLKAVRVQTTGSEFTLPLYDPEKKVILIGAGLSSEADLNPGDLALVTAVERIFLLTSK